LQQVLRNEQQQRVRRALAALRPVHAQALFLRVCGYSYKELGDSLAIKTGSVGTLLLRAEAEFEKHYLKLYGRKETL
jgi:DNA-directed RNA polymerase specialized sigma24 family protein